MSKNNIIADSEGSCCRITETSKTLIDVVITNKPENYLKSGIIHIGISDHCVAYTCRKLYLCQKVNIK